MQKEALDVMPNENNVVLLSPTGSGKTLAFLLPLFESLDKESNDVQALIIEPSRELAIQVEQVAREMGTGFKINLVYGGRPFSKEKMQLKHAPSVLIGTAGRVADHIRRESIDVSKIHTLILDEFDKSLEIGFEDEMTEIVEALPELKKRILTSATQKVQVQRFLGLKSPKYINFLMDGDSKLKMKIIQSPVKDKLDSLVTTLYHLGDQSGIVFCNFKDSLKRVSDHLEEHGIAHACFHGGMEQKERERSLIQFRNGSQRLLVATDLAARGIDVPALNFILHYHLPPRGHEFIHRNGRTARMHKEGTAYVLIWEEEPLPDFIDSKEVEIIKVGALELNAINPTQDWLTLFVSGGRKDKISKGDIAGLFFKQGKLEKGQLGNIELKDDCAFVAVASSEAERVVGLLDNARVKKRKVRVRVLED